MSMPPPRTHQLSLSFYLETKSTVKAREKSKLMMLEPGAKKMETFLIMRLPPSRTYQLILPLSRWLKLLLRENPQIKFSVCLTPLEGLVGPLNSISKMIIEDRKPRYRRRCVIVEDI